MPYSRPEKASWDVDPKALSKLEGGKDLHEWFGFSTTFHDDEIVQASFDAKNAKLTVAAFRMTSETDENGFYIQDRKATVTIELMGVTGIAIEGKFPTQVLEMGFREVVSNGQLPSNSLAEVGDIELAFDDVYGGGGSIFAKTARLSFEPVESSK